MYGKKERYKRLAFDFFLEILGLIAVFFILQGIQTSFSISQQKENSSDKLDIAVQRLESNREEAADRLAKYDDFSYAKIDSITYYYEKNEDAITDASLKEMANQWSLDELFVVDGKRNIVCSSTKTKLDFSDESFSMLWNENSEGLTIDSMRYYASVIQDDVYLIGGRDISAFNANEAELTSIPHSLHTIRVGSKGYIVAIQTSDNTIAYHPDDTLIGQPLKSAHLDASVMKDGYDGWATCAGEEFYAESRNVTLDEISYQLIALRPRAMMESTIMQMVWMITLVFAVVLTLITLYMHFVRVEQDKRYLTEHAEMEFVHIGGNFYINQTIGEKAIHILIIGIVVIFLASFYMQTLSVLSTRSARSAEKMEDIEQIFNENQEQLQSLKNEYVAEYEGRTKNIAFLLGKDPSMVDTVSLTELSKRAQIKYIYVFNEKGEVAASNGVYTEFSVSHDATDPSYEYWNVIAGYQDIIIKDPEESTYEPGTYIQYIGTTRIDEPGMVQLGISPQRLESRIKAVETPFTLANIAVENNGFTMAVKKEDSTVTYYPNSNYIGNTADSIGLEEAALTDNYTGYQTLDGVQCFVTSMEYGDEFIYVAVPLANITSGRLPLALAAAGISLVVILIILILALTANPKKLLTLEDAALPNGPLKEPSGTIEIITASGEKRRVDSVLSRWNLNGIKWADCTAEQKLKKVLFWILAVCAIFLIFYMATQIGTYNKNSILSYIINQRWEKRPNIFSFTYIAFIVVEVIAIVTVIRKLLALFLSNTGARAETIGRLLGSFIKYMSVLGTLFYCLNFIGVDSSTILASAGLLTLIVGLGAQSMVSDILAGIFIVFEGEFRVGDIVTVNGWRGIVREIGIRSTKIEDFTQDIKVINNSQISGVINMTKKYSYAACDIGIEYSESLERVESILEQELPLVKDRLPDIIAGPFYRGVAALDASSVTIKVVAQCAEARRVQLNRDLNREMKLIFDKHNINIPFPQVVINQPVAAHTATAAEKKLADEYVKEQKAATLGMAEDEDEDQN